MIGDLTKEDWLTILGIPEDWVPAVLLLWGTRNLKTRYAAMRPQFSQVLEIGGPNGLLEDVLIGMIDDTCVAYASVYGAPMAAEVVHLFGVLGTHRVIQIGTCGGLCEELKAGDLFVAEEAYCGEGASQYYKANGDYVRATPTFAQLTASDAGGIPIVMGKIYTTSALFAESSAYIDKWARLGFSAVDMETAASFAVAEHFGMERASILAVFDNPRGQDHIMAADPEKEERRGSAQKMMVEIALAALVANA